MPIKQITPGESKSYVPFDEDFESSSPAYFTLCKSSDPNYPADMGWEDVRYFSSKTTTTYSNREGEGDSWVYILYNPSMPNYLKIGSTSKTPELRAKELSRGTAIPTDFEVVYAFYCFNALACEIEIHNIMNPLRVSKQREFFSVSLDEAIEVVERVGKRYV